VYGLSPTSVLRAAGARSVIGVANALDVRSSRARTGPAPPHSRPNGKLDLPMESTTLSDGSVLRTSDRVSLHVTEFTNGVVRHTCVGRMPGELCRCVTDNGEAQIKRFGRVVFMVDGYDSTVSTEFREEIAAWFRDHREVAVARILIRSKLLDMAISVANLVAGKHVLIPYSDVGEWESAGRRECPHFARLVASPRTIGGEAERRDR
jgi:hypothetical protein